MKRSPAFFALALVFVQALALAPATPASAASIPETVPGARTVDASQAKQLFDKGVTFVDLRRDRKWKAGRVPGAVHLEFRNVFSEATLGQHVQKSQAVVFYFDKCRRCAKAIEQAVDWGYAKVYFFRDGMRSWEKNGYPVESSGQAGGAADANRQDKKARNQQTAEPAPSPSPSATATGNTQYNVILVNAGDAKVGVIQAVREVMGLSLMEAKNLVDNAPKALKQGVSADEAFEMRDKLLAKGATVKLNGKIYEPGSNAVSPSASATEAAAAEQTEFTVVLVSVGDMKIQVIKAVREITGLGLKEAKELVDNAPKPVKEGVSKDEAFAMKDLLEAQGATVELK